MQTSLRCLSSVQKAILLVSIELSTTPRIISSRFFAAEPSLTRMESPSLSFSIASLNEADSWSVIIPAALYAEREFPESIGECPSIM